MSSFVKCTFCNNEAKLNIHLSREVNPKTGERYEEEQSNEWEGDDGPYGYHYRSIPVCCFGMRFETIDLCDTFAQEWYFGVQGFSAFVDEHGHAWRDFASADPSKEIIHRPHARWIKQFHFLEEHNKVENNQ